MADPRNPIGLCRVPLAALYDKRLSRTDLAVLVAIGEHTNDAGTCYPSQERLGAYSGVGRRRANKAVQRLIECGYLLTFGRDRRRCLYQILPGPDANAEPPAEPTGDDAPPDEGEGPEVRHRGRTTRRPAL